MYLSSLLHTAICIKEKIQVKTKTNTNKKYVFLIGSGFSKSVLLLQTLCKLHPVLQGDKAYLLSEQEQSACLQMTLTERESCGIK